MYTDGGYQCENCKRQFARENLICPSCEYPITGTEDEKNLFYHKLETARHELKGMEEKIHQAKLCLWIIAGVNLFYGLLYYMFQPGIE